MIINTANVTLLFKGVKLEFKKAYEQFKESSFYAKLISLVAVGSE